MLSKLKDGGANSYWRMETEIAGTTVVPCLLNVHRASGSDPDKV